VGQLVILINDNSTQVSLERGYVGQFVILINDNSTQVRLNWPT
jgi:hypothetical protein